ncbi:hypothetical protein ACFZCF_29705 [Streptomyces sp. NPDC007945]|uniref:hypothetical protein n=1 Tax=Streptomyces sp. NPDC007945 TaxID=3364797 RepID=UPI0036EC9DE6
MSETTWRAGVVDLHPDRPATGLRGLHPVGEELEGRSVVEKEADWGGQRLGTDHHVAGDQQTGPAGRPAAVQSEHLFTGELAGAGHVPLHRRLRDPVLQHLPQHSSSSSSSENISLVIRFPLPFRSIRMYAPFT